VPLKPRQYSISSSPLWSANHCTLTIAVVDAPALSGHGRYRGAASTYLSNARPGTKVAVTTRASNVAFHLPESLETPMILICAGTGIAPFHGFLQERAIRMAQQAPGKVGPALLFFGCDHPEVDFLYKEELAEWEALGVVSVRPAFSAAPQEGVVFVQDRLWKDRAEVMALVKEGAILFVCGDGRQMAPAVHEVCVRMYHEATRCSQEEADQWMTEMEVTHGRYVADVFS
jgi:cytochrome P450/NADPH-cytochrome P450 reductase